MAKALLIYMYLHIYARIIRQKREISLIKERSVIVWLAERLARVGNVKQVADNWPPRRLSGKLAHSACRRPESKICRD